MGLHSDFKFAVYTFRKKELSCGLVGTLSKIK